MLANETSVRLILDECVSRRLTVDKHANFGITHTIDVLGWSVSDSEVLRYLLTSEFDYFVTSDVGLLQECERHGINTVRYHRGCVFFENGKVVELGKHTFYTKVAKSKQCGHYMPGLGYRRDLVYNVRGYFFAIRRRYRKYIGRPVRKGIRRAKRTYRYR